MKMFSVCERFQTGRAALLRGLNFWRHGSAALPLLTGTILLVGIGTKAEMTNALSDAEFQGRQLVQQLLQQQPVTNFTQTGVLKIRDAQGKRSEIPIVCKIIVTVFVAGTNITIPDWQTFYQATLTNRTEYLRVIHTTGLTDIYSCSTNASDAVPVLGDIPLVGHLFGSHQVSGLALMSPFAGSDFWIADLGLEFFHWPAQKILKKEFRRNCSCVVLESTNPDPATNGYSRVDSWIDEASGGIVMANAYDAQGKLLKEFHPKDFKKVKGQWQVERMDIDNIQTGSHTRLEFDLKAP
jgi:hypothetical protein